MPPTKYWVHPGQRYGRLTVIAQELQSRHHYWICQCECGTQTSVYKYSLLKGLTTSCGCRSKGRSTRHGFTTHEGKARIYHTWQGMWARCRNPNHQEYGRYGGRGITVCARWRDFVKFFEDVGFPPSAKYSLDRIDPNGQYEPSNVRWATAREQNRNMRSNVWFEFEGQRKILTDWARERGLIPETVRKRLRLGWSPRKAFGFVSESYSVPDAQIGSVA